jgi:peptidase E
MESIVLDIAKKRMERDFNNALRPLGLFISSLHLDESKDLSLVVEISVLEDADIVYAS